MILYEKKLVKYNKRNIILNYICNNYEISLKYIRTYVNLN